MSESLQLLWLRLTRTELEFFEARKAFLEHRGDSVRELDEALNDPAQRGTALRLLRYLPIEARHVLFPQLVHLASFSHGDVVLVRSLISELGPEWLQEHLSTQVRRITSRPDVSYEEYRRLAELLSEVDLGLLQELALQAKSNADPDVREVGEEYLS